MAGRPSRFTDELAYRICIHIQHGATHKMAAEAEGVPLSTFDTWLARRTDFRTQVQRAEASARTELLKNLAVAAARGNVHAMTWLLERLEPQAFGEPARRLEVSGTVSLDVDVTALSDDDLDTLARGEALPASASRGRTGAPQEAASLRLIGPGE